jgi:hypothetical protein
MLRWGNYWSGGEQFFCKFAEGGYVEFQLPVKKEATYRVRVLGTSAPFHGKIEFMLDGKKVGKEIDLYSGRVSSSGSLELDTHTLTQGDHTLRVTCIGKNPASTGLAFGLDVVDLLEGEGTPRE